VDKADVSLSPTGSENQSIRAILISSSQAIRFRRFGARLEGAEGEVIATRVRLNPNVDNSYIEKLSTH